jgi:hypothetical protein
MMQGRSHVAPYSFRYTVRRRNGPSGCIMYRNQSSIMRRQENVRFPCDTTPGLDSGDPIDWDRQVRNRSVRSTGADAVSGTAGFQLALSETGSEIWGKGSII